MKKNSVLIIALVCVSLITTACAKNEESKDPLIGSWVSDDFSIEFEKDNVGTLKDEGESMPFKWKTEDTILKKDMVKISLDDGGLYRFVYSINEDELSLIELDEYEETVYFERYDAIEEGADPFLGKWILDNDGMVIEFLEDGTGKIENEDDLDTYWEKTDDTLSIAVERNNVIEMLLEGTYTMDNDTITMENASMGESNQEYTLERF